MTKKLRSDRGCGGGKMAALSLVPSDGSFTSSCPVTSVADVLSRPMTASPSRCLVPSNGSVAPSCLSLLAASRGAMGRQEDNKRRTRGQQAARKPCKSQEARPVPKRDLVQQGRQHRAARVHRHVGGSLSQSGFGMEGWSLDAVQD